MTTLQKYDASLKVGWYYDCTWKELKIDDIEMVRGSGESAEPKEDSVQLCFS